jgi:GTP-binding protein
MHALFFGYAPLAGEVQVREHGSLVAHEPGVTTSFGLANAQERGIMFVGPGVEVYEGMIVGEQPRDGDIPVNVCKKKHLTNMRSSNADIAVQLTPPRIMSLDDAIEYVSEDELVEVTPRSLRLRKRILNNEQRGKMLKAAQKARDAEREPV